MKKVIFTTAALSATLATTLLLSGCATQKSAVPDISQTSIALPVVRSSEIPSVKRVVALANGSAEIIAALGYSSIVVGRDVASTIPELIKVPIDNPGHTVSIEKILSQKPDLILIDSNTVWYSLSIKSE